MYLSRPANETSGIMQYASRARQLSYLLDMHHRKIIYLEPSERFLLKRGLKRMDDVIRDFKRGSKYDLDDTTQLLFHAAISIVRIFTDGKLNQPE